MGIGNAFFDPSGCYAKTKGLGTKNRNREGAVAVRGRRVLTWRRGVSWTRENSWRVVERRGGRAVLLAAMAAVIPRTRDFDILVSHRCHLGDTVGLGTSQKPKPPTSIVFTRFSVVLGSAVVQPA